MKLELVTGISTYEATKNAFLSIDKTDVDTEYFIVVPDRFTLKAEEVLFNTLNIESTFNLNIVSLTNLAQKVLVDLKEERGAVSQIEGVLGIIKIVNENQDKLLFYKKTTPNFCFEILKSIMQIKSSMLRPEDIKYDGENKTLKEKFHDLSLIYECYEKMFSEKLDPSDLAMTLGEKALSSKLLSNSVVMFAGFDSFTEMNFSLLRLLLPAVKKVVISIPKSENFGNDYIYENDIYEKVKEIAKSMDVEIEVISPKCNLNKNALAIANNLFSKTKSVLKSDYLHVSASPSKRKEVEYIADLLKYKVFHGARYKDFAIAVSSLEGYEDLIEEVFTEREIPFYIDSSKNISFSSLSVYIKKIFDLKRKNFTNEDLLYLISSPLFSVENKNDLIAFVNEKGICGKSGFFKYLSNDLSETDNYIKALESANFYSDYCAIIRKIIKDTEPKFLEYLQQLEDKNLFKEKTLEEQVPEAIEKILQILDQNNEKTSLNDFVSILEIAFSLTEVSALPAFADAVFVGDATSSYFTEVRNLIVLGASRGKLPVAMSDSGMISDKDIQRLDFKNKIGPSVKMINRRNRFKLFNNLLLAKENLYVSFFAEEDGSPTDKAIFVKELMEIFGLKNPINTADITYFEKGDENLERFLFALGNKVSANQKLFEFLKNREMPENFVASLQSVLKPNYEDFYLNREKLTGDNISLFFPRGNFSVSQMERFYDCPFKHFVDYGLRLKQKENPNIEKNELGTFFHGILEKFVKIYKNNLKNIEDKTIREFLSKNLEKILRIEKIEFANDRALVLKNLYKDAFRLCKRVVKENKYSRFNPVEEELIISDDLIFNGKKISLKGKIDRVDEFEDKFRVVDYKTGKVSNGIFKDLYYGKKIQLFLYSKVLEKKLGLKPAGIYYFNASTEFNEEKTILKGLTSCDINLIDTRFYDKDFKKSDIISATRTKNGISFAQTTEKVFDSMHDYSLKISEFALSKIEEGNIKPLPDEKSCDYCKYRGICLFNNKNGTRKLAGRDEKVFIEEGQDEF